MTKKLELKRENPFDVIAKEALKESKASETMTLEECEQELKQNIKRTKKPQKP
jgi:hypothetical protein